MSVFALAKRELLSLSRLCATNSGQLVGPMATKALCTVKLLPFIQSHFVRSSSSAIATADRRQAKQQHLVVALGGNALLKRKQEMSMENQRKNIREGMESLKHVLNDYKVTMVHGNGPQVGLLCLQGAEYEKQTGLKAMKLDVLDAETEGMIGYMLEQAILEHIPPTKRLATVLSQIVVDEHDPAFANPTKFVGPVYTKEEAAKLLMDPQTVLKPDGDYYRRVVPSPKPQKMIENQLNAVKLLTDSGCVVICAGGGGIPVVVQDQDEDAQTNPGQVVKGVEAVIDKDRAACMLGLDLNADGLVILTDVPGCALNYNYNNNNTNEQEKWIKAVSPEKLKALMEHFPSGSMGPKVESVIEFVQRKKKQQSSSHSSSSGSGWAAIGSLTEADKILTGEAGTRIISDHGVDFIEFYDEQKKRFNTTKEVAA